MSRKPGVEDDQAIVEAIGDIIFPYNATEYGQDDVFEALVCHLVGQASMMFCAEHAASAISEAVNAYLLLEKQDAD